MVSWAFFVRGLEPSFVGNALAIRMAETQRVVAIGQNVSLIRSPSQLPFHKRVSQPPTTSIGAYYRPIHFPVRVPIAGTACERLNISLFRREMGQLLPDRPNIVCYDSPKQHSLIGVLREDLTVYYVTDDLTVTVQGTPIQGEWEMEQRLLNRVHLIVCINGSLAEKMRERTVHLGQIPIHVVPNFYDERVFDPKITHPEPQPLRRVPRPRILVAGHISERIDWEGIITASRLKPEWSWVFLGRVADPGMEERVGWLEGRGTLMAGVPFAEVPAWIQHSDVCAVPYRLNPFTLASDPLKAPEYLAMGAATLSTRIPALARFEEAVYWVGEGNGESYARALDRVAQQSGNNRLGMLRRRAAAPDSLAARADQFRTIILEYLKAPLNEQKEFFRAHQSAGG